MKKTIILASALICLSCKEDRSEKVLMAQNSMEQPAEIQSQGIHRFEVEDINGEVFRFADLKGKKVMVVNTASKCGLTPQYEQLQELYDTYGGEDFVIVGFPANNFGNQEPGTNEDIAEFCQLNYGVSFPMMSKISVKGDDMHPVYRFLTRKAENGYADSEVQWNFQKYLIDASGQLVGVVDPQTLPNDASVIDWINRK